MLAVALEALPLAAGLKTVTTLVTGSPTDEPLPFWLLVVVIFVAVAVGARLRHYAIPGALALLVTLGGAVTFVLALRISPAAYGAVPPALSLDWLAQVPQDLVTGSARVAGAVGLLTLTAYLWWRGVRLGGQGATYDQTYRMFRVGLAVMALALVVTSALSGQARVSIDAQLALLLPAQVGFGLMALTLAHINDYVTQRAPSARASSGGPDANAASQARWALTALGLAAIVVAAALLLALALSYNTAVALVQGLRPVGDLLDTIIQWLIGVVSFLLFLLLNGPLEWIRAHINGQPAPIQRPTPIPSNEHSRSPSFARGIPHEWLVAGQVVVFALLIVGAVVCAYLWLQALRRARLEPDEAGLEETREGLDARGLLGAQLRGLFTSHRAARGDHADEGLSGSDIRRLYRDVLRAALLAGYGRRAAETPVEYYQRQVSATPDSARALTADDGPNREARQSALASLTGLYERARYGNLSDRVADQEGRAQPAAQRLITWFTRQRRRQQGTRG